MPLILHEHAECSSGMFPKRADLMAIAGASRDRCFTVGHFPMADSLPAGAGSICLWRIFADSSRESVADAEQAGRKREDTLAADRRYVEIKTALYLSLSSIPYAWSTNDLPIAAREANKVATRHTRPRSVPGMPVRQVETGLWPAAIKEVICPKSHATPQGIAANGPAHQIMQWRGRMGIGAHLDTDGAVGALHPPEAIAGLLIALPLLHAPAEDFIARLNRC